ncbi:Spy/CpxP family protein refolding chaperone [Halalkalibaculum sp. DA3122]|uniref:Spy/CpxP family protein refolding chaperone n=1 Tax=Halalkalibaculum sp. DA3122 TaxID=3373607 RepID=UPI0037545DE7
MKQLNSIFLTLLLLALTTTAFAQRSMPDRGRSQQADRPMYRIPDLTDEQHEQIRQIHLDAQQRGLEIRNQLNEHRARLRTLTTGSDIDLNAANEVIDEIGSLTTQLMKQRLETRMKVRNLLTDEQKVVFDAHSPFARGNLQGMRSGRRGVDFRR